MNFQFLPSLKLTCSPLENAWKMMKFPFGALFLGLFSGVNSRLLRQQNSENLFQLSNLMESSQVTFWGGKQKNHPKRSARSDPNISDTTRSKVEGLGFFSHWGKRHGVFVFFPGEGGDAWRGWEKTRWCLTNMFWFVFLFAEMIQFDDEHSFSDGLN